MEIEMIGHSTVVIQIGKTRILTDPFLTIHGNPMFKRLTLPARKREDLVNAVDLVLVTHDHWDHIDRQFFSKLAEKVPVIVPAPMKGYCRLFHIKNSIGLKRWQQFNFADLSITAVPARHLAFANGYILKAPNKTIYFAGDTFCGNFMSRIGDTYQVDLALLPVITYRMPMTMNHNSAARAVQLVSPKVIIPIHLGIEPRSPLMRTGETVLDFQAAMREKNPDVKVVVLKEGEKYDDMT